ncbi:MAG TPA: DUF983 domain-containing protein [Pyrinomonadaceae bacterium]|nr:DUF983 domain-containing protein [Pyrinomonadaceae bacterium]
MRNNPARRSILQTLGRALRLRCPACGTTSIVQKPFHVKHHCEHCHALFKREEGFFVGAILMNVVMSELIILVVCFFALLLVGADYENVLKVLFVVAILFPILFFHHSWSLWLAFDYLIESLPKYEK